MYEVAVVGMMVGGGEPLSRLQLGLQVRRAHVVIPDRIA
jgi:hypothetical protein